ncbi:7007_t:CDS:1, partial [Funneliformis mosseae]
VERVALMDFAYTFLRAKLLNGKQSNARIAKYLVPLTVPSKLRGFKSVE